MLENYYLEMGVFFVNIYTPAYLVFSNYEIVLNWNRSLRFALAVCTLKDNFKNEI